MSAHVNSTPRPYRMIEEADVTGKRVLCRVDLNVPTEHGRISDRTRIERIVPTIRHLAERNAKIILISHFGRPKDTFEREYSLAQLADALEVALPDINVKFALDCIGDTAKNAVDALENGQVLLLENLRFHAGEKKNTPEFVTALAASGDIYVNESFSCSHRKHASIDGLARALPAYAGFLLDEEITSLESLLLPLEKPAVAIVGGSKISTKIGLLRHLVKQCTAVAVGGAMANTFLKAQDCEIGASLFEPDLLDEANAITALAKDHNCDIILPVDVVTADSITSGHRCDVYDAADTPAHQMILDAGPETVQRICMMIAGAKTLIWNGPLGVLEYRPFDTATVSVARYAALCAGRNGLKSVAGGGDVIAGLQKAGLSHALTYVSTAGGAFLEWLEDPDLPGIRALTESVA